MIQRLGVGLDDALHETRFLAFDFASMGVCTLAFVEGSLIERSFIEWSALNAGLSGKGN
jgi:hypothetical protein